MFTYALCGNENAQNTILESRGGQSITKHTGAGSKVWVKNPKISIEK